MEISASMVKDLREKTGAGMMDCKKALVETNGDMDKAIDYLREKGFDFEFQSLPYQDISSTELRQKILNGEDIDGYVAQEVKEYILKNGLYQN